MKLTVPKRFELAGRTWHVKHVGKKSWYGRTNGARCLIELSSKSKDEQELFHTFLHELGHAIYYVMGKDKLFADEFLIDGQASLQLQVMLSAR